MHTLRSHRFTWWRNFLFYCFCVVAVLMSACSSTSSAVTAKQSPTATSAPTATPTPIITNTSLSALVANYVNSMSLNDKIGQLIFAQSYSGGIYQYPTSAIIQQFHPGGLIVYEGELQTLQQSQDYFKNIKAHSPIPIVIGTDNEGGAEWRLSNIFQFTPPSAYTIGSTGNPVYAYQQGTQMASYITQVGMNMDLAPVVDVHPTGFDRDFSTVPSEDALMAGSWLAGLQNAGIIGTLKHFPGLGDTYLDPHMGLPIDNSSLSHIESYGLEPYRLIINSATPPDAIMTTDILVRAVDPNSPAEISYKVITGLLRDQLHYNGVVITDALYMGGMGQYMCQLDNVQNCDPLTYARNNPSVLARLGVMALQAGCDMILGTYDVATTQAMVDAIKAALNNGQLTMARIDQSVERIIMMKVTAGLMKIPGMP